MGGREGVVDIDIAELSQRPRKIWRVRLFALVEAEIFEERDLPGPERRNDLFRLFADAVCGEGDLSAVDCLAQGCNQRPQRIGWVRSTLRAAEMGHHNHLGALLDQRI